MAELRFPAPPLADDVVLLRPWREADAPATFLAFSDPVVQRFSWPQPTPDSEEDTRQYFAELEAARLLGEELNLALVPPGDTGPVLGGGSLYDVRPEQGCASVGYWLAPEARGRGVATHAVRLLARWAFTGLGLAWARRHREGKHPVGVDPRVRHAGVQELLPLRAVAGHIDLQQRPAEALVLLAMDVDRDGPPVRRDRELLAR